MTQRARTAATLRAQRRAWAAIEAHLGEVATSRARLARAAGAARDGAGLLLLRLADGYLEGLAASRGVLLLDAPAAGRGGRA